MARPKKINPFDDFDDDVEDTIIDKQSSEVYSDKDYKINLNSVVDTAIDNLPLPKEEQVIKEDLSDWELDVKDSFEIFKTPPTPPYRDDGAVEIELPKTAPKIEEEKPQVDTNTDNKIPLDDKDISELSEIGAEGILSILDDVQCMAASYALDWRTKRTTQNLIQLYEVLEKKVSEGKASPDEQVLFSKMSKHMNGVENWKESLKKGFHIPKETQKKAAKILGAYFEVTKQPPNPILIVCFLIVVPIIGNVMVALTSAPPKMEL